MDEQKLSYQNMPEHYLLCYNTQCPLAEKCLRQLAAKEQLSDDTILHVVNPRLYSGSKCPYYREKKMVTNAYGMVHVYDKVLANDVVALRHTIIQHFGNGSYYMRRNGKQPITPDEQAFINQVFSQYGYAEGATFDDYKEELLW